MNDVAASYDAAAADYAAGIADEMSRKPVDRAWVRCLHEVANPAGIVADVGCGPGHVGAFLAGLGRPVIGVDLSPAMIEIARGRYPELGFVVGSMLALPADDGAWAGAVCPYSIIHLAGEERPVAFAELARVIEPEGWLLLSFHVRDATTEPGEVKRVDTWWDRPVALDFHYLDPDVIAKELVAQGFTVMAVTRRQPWPNQEHASERCHLLAQRG